MCTQLKWKKKIFETSYKNVLALYEGETNAFDRHVWMCERVQKLTEDQESEARPSDNVLYLRSTISGNQWKKDKERGYACLFMDLPSAT